MLGTDLGAVFLVDLASFHGFVATVTAIVTTAFIVVLVVANAITFEFVEFTRLLVCRWFFLCLASFAAVI